MVAFASPEWIAALGSALEGLVADGPALRVRYRFPADDGTDRGRGYDLIFGHGVRAEAASAEVDSRPVEDGGTPVVTVVQPASVAREVAAGRVAAQQALLDGTIEVSGPVTTLLTWGDTLQAIDARLGELRARTDWS